MKNRVKAFFMAVLMLLLTVFTSVRDMQIVKAAEDLTLKLHYQKIRRCDWITSWRAIA